MVASIATTTKENYKQFKTDKTMKKYIKETIKRNEFATLDETNYLDDPTPYSLGVRTKKGKTYKTIACYTNRLQAEQAYDTLVRTFNNWTK